MVLVLVARLAASIDRVLRDPSYCDLFARELVKRATALVAPAALRSLRQGPCHGEAALSEASLGRLVDACCVADVSAREVDVQNPRRLPLMSVVEGDAGHAHVVGAEGDELLDGQLESAIFCVHYSIHKGR